MEEIDDDLKEAEHDDRDAFNDDTFGAAVGGGRLEGVRPVISVARLGMQTGLAT